MAGKLPLNPWGTPGALADLWRLQGQLAMMAFEAQTVIAIRVLGMAGLWAVRPTENTRMVTEKSTAFLQSAQAAMSAAAEGKRPDQIVTAAVKPIRRRTSSNVRRLSRLGPQIGPQLGPR